MYNISQPISCPLLCAIEPSNIYFQKISKLPQDMDHSICTCESEQPQSRETPILKETQLHGTAGKHVQSSICERQPPLSNYICY